MVLGALLWSGAGPLSAAEPAGEPPKELRLFLLIGQSNMAGRGKVEPQDQVTDPRIWMLTKDLRWVPAKDPVHFDKPVAGVGLCSEFARTLVRKDDKSAVGLIPCAVGGTPLDAWLPGGKQDSLYNTAVARTKEALKSGRLAGILWHQGESDQGRPEWVASYAERFRTMITQLRKDLAAEHVPVIVGELGHAQGDSARVPFNEVIHHLPELVPDCAWASAKGICTDGLHFKDAAAYRAFGVRYAEAYLALIAKTSERGAGQ